MKELDIKELLRRAEELRALFVLGQRVIPFLEDLFTFVGEVQPLLEEINNSIKENLSKMPNLTKQLSKVTEATELATNEILDIIDGIFYKLDILQSNLKEIENNCNVVDNFVDNFSTLMMRKESSQINPEYFIEEINKIFENFKSEYNKMTSFSTFKEMIESIRTDSTSIMLALQVQDITSQQIAAVNHLLDTVQNRLTKLLSKFNSNDVQTMVSQATETINVSKLHREVAFDPDAVETLVGNSTKQDEIDRLFQQGISTSIEKNKVETKEKNFGSEFETKESPIEEDKPISQSDIDALFEQNKQNK
ncbi:MAG: protein phosphatase CheZ [Ignavibacteria bacterium]|nr:protein phosphatase CheZ [Ignavibacteria bacterium]